MAIGTERYLREDVIVAPDERKRSPRADMPDTPGAATRTIHEMEGGSFGESLAGAAGVVLAVLGIIGLLPTVLGAVSAIAVGLGLFLGGGVIAARLNRLWIGFEGEGARRQTLGGLGMEALAGLAGAVLGLLSLLGLAPITLLSVSALVLGAALLMESGATARLELALGRAARHTQERTHEAVYVASGSDFIVGAGAVVLGILALAGNAPVTLSLIALLSVGAAGMLRGSTLAARMFELFGA